jgi:hypothetical protein
MLLYIPDSSWAIADLVNFEYQSSLDWMPRESRKFSAILRVTDIVFDAVGASVLNLRRFMVVIACERDVGAYARWKT